MYAHVNLFDFDTIYIPVLVDNRHYFLVLVSMVEQRIISKDSFGHHQNMPHLHNLLSYLKFANCDTTSASKAPPQYDWNKWDLQETTVYGPNGSLITPQQFNPYDGGVFTCMFAIYHCRKLPMLFSQAFMNVFRVHLTIDIMRASLLLPSEEAAHGEAP